MTSVIHDLRYAMRNALRAPGFFLAALLTLGIGTGANATVFSFINALLLRPVPGVPDPSSLVAVYTSDFSSGPYGDTSYPDYLTLKQASSALRGLAAYTEGSALIRAGATVERVRRMTVSPEFFELLGVRASIGRLLQTADFNRGAPGVVIGDGFWRRALDGDPAVLGRAIVIDDVTHTVVGVAPPAFTGLTIAGFDLWLPLAETVMDSGRGDRGLSVVGRLADGASVEEANAQVTALAARLARDYPQTNRGTLQNPESPRPMLVVPHTRMPAAFRGQVMALGGVLMGAVLLVLLIACANVASLMLARATSRRREVAIRLSIGAGRGRVAQQMLTESLLLGAGGCVVGVLFSLWTADVLPSFFPPEQALLLDAAVDARVFAYTAAVSLVAALLFGMAPAIQAFRTPSTASLRPSAGEVTARGGGRLRRALIAAQIALATVLLVSSGLLVQSLVNTLSADLGFAARHALLASVELPGSSAPPDRSLAIFESALARVRAVPGVEAATVTTALPLNRTSRRGFRIDGYVPRPGEDREFPYFVVDHTYFRTLQIDVLEGRAFDARDDLRAERVVMVNALFAQRYFAGHAVGKRITDSRGRSLAVVGVVTTGKYRTVHEAVPTVYYPFAQAPETTMSMVVRTAGDPMLNAAAVRAAILEANPDAAVYRVRSLDAHVAEALGGERLTAALVSTCGIVALILAVIGVYGVVSYAVGTRIREIGLRVALGAAPRAIVRLVLREGFRVLATGLVGGLAIAAVAAKALQSLLYGVTPLDGATFTVVVGALAVATVLAAALPARRALAVDPMVALRHE